MCSAQSVLGADLALMDQTKRLHDADWQLINARHWGFVLYSSILVNIVVMIYAYPKNSFLCFSFRLIPLNNVL